MKSFEAETVINARNSTVWDIITDGGNYTVWDSGITRIDGPLRNGGPIRVRTRTGGNRTFRLRVQQIPGEVMIWTGGLPWGLFKSVCTFTLTPDGCATRLRVREEFTGPLVGPMWNTVPDLERAFADYVSAVKKRAELLGRHEARIPPSPGRPWPKSGDGSGRLSARETSAGGGRSFPDRRRGDPSSERRLRVRDGGRSCHLHAFAPHVCSSPQAVLCFLEAPMTNSDADDEQRCDAEQRNFPARHFGVGPGGQFIHIKVRPNWNSPGQGHTMSGQDVWFEGRAVDFQQEWNLIKIWPRL